ncbi:hypothetical protein HDG33_007318 [Paraburkholderia sp. Cpub6]|nr:hypothetical protein [Paraburkholderia sp. Cpub6]
MLNRASNADRNIQLRRDDLAGLADLIVVRHDARINGCARDAERRTELAASGSGTFV